MNPQGLHEPPWRVAGYEALVSRYELDVIPNWHGSVVASTGSRRVDVTLGITEEVYPAKYWPGDLLSIH